jgi:hypothetical protein
MCGNPTAPTQWVFPSGDLAERYSRSQSSDSHGAWSRGQERTAHQQAEQLLIHMVAAAWYPTALHVWYERAFNLTRQERVHEALKLLQSIHAEFEGHLDEDTFSLWGRCHKEPGDRHREAGQKSADGSAVQRSAFKEAEDAYRLAIEQYTKAYAVAGGFFPCINVATLTFLREHVRAFGPQR